MRQRLSKILFWCASLALGACATSGLTGAGSNRPDGEGYAGRGELVLRIGAAPAGGSFFSLATLTGASAQSSEHSAVELRYAGIDSLGRAVFQRRDNDAYAGPPEPAKIPAGGADLSAKAAVPADAEAPDTRKIVLDMRLTRQIHIQGKTIEILEATPSGVIFRVYSSAAG